MARYAISLTAGLLAASVGAAEAETVIKECMVDMRASEGAWVTILEEGGEPKQITLVLAGEMGAIQMGVIPLGGKDGVGNAVVTYQRLEYSRHAFVGEGPIDVFLRDEIRAIVKDGKICAEDGCLFGAMEPDQVQDLYDEFAKTWPGRTDCYTQFGG